MKSIRIVLDRIVLEDFGKWLFKVMMVGYFAFAFGVLVVCVFKFIREITL